MNITPLPSQSPPPLPSSAAPAAVRRWRWWIHLCILSLLPLLAGAASLAGMESRGPALTRGAHGLLIVCAWQLAFFALLFALAWIFSRATLDDLLCRWRGGFWAVPLGIGYSVALRMGIGILLTIGYVLVLLGQGTAPENLESSILKNRPDIESLVDIGALRNNPGYFWLTVTLVSFGLGGLREELWRSAFLAGLRTLWPRWFGSKGGQILAVTVAAMFFGFAHLRMGILAVGMTAMLGFGLGLIMVLHRSIWPAVIAHGAFNATTMALLPWLGEKLPAIQRSLGH